ncbi:MAG: hypothetical protein WA709_36060, partial [Stellaceae bacterium]
MTEPTLEGAGLRPSAKVLDLNARLRCRGCGRNATQAIHVESVFGAKPIRVLTYRPVTSNDSLPAIVHIHGGGFVMGA